MSELEFFRAPNAAAVLTTLGGGPALPAPGGQWSRWATARSCAGPPHPRDRQ
ncbi:hypothetical protein [Kitasatospora sp. NPDC059673]|uniref:hypothetical protein n=1 Tax=Kitasatospora sp. NPDC059673 TaxID=3346901 RepID=UPI0036AA0161